MQPQGGGPDIGALLASLGGGDPAAGAGAPPAGPPPSEGGDWLVEAINAVHEGMVQETDPEQVSALGKIIDLLTTFQAKAHAPKAPAGG